MNRIKIFLFLLILLYSHNNAFAKSIKIKNSIVNLNEVVSVSESNTYERYVAAILYKNKMYDYIRFKNYQEQKYYFDKLLLELNK